ncbi:unnamed protein product [Soboliphyme baturini]|uniref:Regulator of telomere elongation helicase 1 homolog n=1 Tax=Soboliphyme baturini TaxID=241478 RepID=A0A183J4I4_9BILA|nr:unnamed protein product [Soboliphyme baturini]
MTAFQELREQRVKTMRLEIGKFEVDFPYVPYPCQVDYMRHVITCLEEGRCGIFDSPTGTGKTLCLLCACFAWRDNFRMKAQSVAPLQTIVGSTNVKGSQISSARPCQESPFMPKIIYSSRTHSQLSQVIKELNKTSYKNVTLYRYIYRAKVCIMGSRDQLCINESVASEPNSVIKTHLCRAKEKVCEDSGSFTFSSKDVAGCIKEATEVLKKLMNEEEALRKEMDHSAKPFGVVDIASDDNGGMDIDLNELAHLVALLGNFEAEIDKIDLTVRDGSSQDLRLKGRTFGGSFLHELLNNSNIRSELRDPILELIDKISSYLAVYVTVDDTVKTNHNLVTLDTKNITRRPLLINHWCFSAGVGMELILRSGLRSVIITSGTLFPLDYFVQEMRMSSALTFESDYAFSSKQCVGGVLTSGPDGISLVGNYENRKNESYLSSLGSSLVNMCRVCPQGMLVFFASYSQLSACCDFWNASGVLERLKKLKRVFVETRNKEQLQILMKEFEEAATDKQKEGGAIMFAVCRGKLSEGFDFADATARTVVIIGIPYPPMLDPRVCLKKEFLNERGSKEKLTGEIWYTLEAVRTVCQAMGRAIRHKDDFGAVVLADSRYITAYTCD